MTAAPGGRRRLAFWAVLAVLGLGATLVLLEAGARVLLLVSPDAWPSRAEMRATLAGSEPAEPSKQGEADRAEGPGDVFAAYVVHPYVGFVRGPKRGYEVMAGRVIREPANDLGFYGPPVPERSEEGVVTVALTGGSVALELYLYGRDALVEALEASPALAGRKVRLASVALGGFKQPQQLMSLGYLLVLGRRPDVVINLDGFNEIVLALGENLPFGVSPYYPRSWGLLAGRLATANVEGLVRLAEKRRALEGWRRVFSSFPLRHSTFALMVWTRLAAAREGEIRALDRALTERSADAADSLRNLGPPYPARSDGEVLTDLADLWARSSLQMERLADENGVAYFHFLQPNQYVPGSKQLTPEERRTAFLPQHPQRLVVSAGYPYLRRAGARLAEQGVAFIDLTDLFRDEAGTVYRDPCCHLTDAGYALLARAVGRVVGAGLARRQAAAP